MIYAFEMLARDAEKRRPHIVGDIRLEAYRIVCVGHRQGERVRVKRVATDILRGSAVNVIAQNRVTYRCKMNSELMRAPGLRKCLYNAYVIVAI